MKYDRDWKKKTKKWVEKHKHSNGISYWAIHYIYNDIEYLNGDYPTEESALADLNNYQV